jgi:hypothetical protein
MNLDLAARDDGFPFGEWLLGVVGFCGSLEITP